MSHQECFSSPAHSGSFSLDQFVDNCLLECAPEHILHVHRDAVHTQIQLLTTECASLDVKFDPTCFVSHGTREAPLFSFSSGGVQFGICEIAYGTANVIQDFNKGDFGVCEHVNSKLIQIRKELLCLLMVVQGEKLVNSKNLPVQQSCYEAVLDRVIKASQPLIASGWKVGLGLSKHIHDRQSPWFKKRVAYPRGDIHFFDRMHIGRCGFYPLDTRNKRVRRLYQEGKKLSQVANGS